jgi:exopolyphosphatase/guanosine-5'-triphosphate,3'-diphosphate pyrophosphatase
LNRIAVIDIGTNSVLYLLVEKKDEDKAVSGHQEIRTTRLGRHLASSGRIGERELAKTIAVLREFQFLAEHQKADTLVCVCTQVFRKAKNRKSALDQIQKETGIPIEVLSENEEAEWSFRGAVYGRNFDFPVLVADIGGGSTEYALGEATRPIQSVSVPIGAVVLTEKYLHHDPPMPDEYKQLDAEVRTQIDTLVSELIPSGVRLMCVGGTVTTLAALELGLDIYDPRRVDGVVLHLETIGRWLLRLQSAPLVQKQLIVKIDPDRADILTAGLIILKATMDIANLSSVRVSDRGLRFGIALRELGLILR